MKNKNLKSKRTSFFCHQFFKTAVSHSYYTIDGKPVFSIFSPANLIVGLGGVDETRDALDWLREKARSKGFPGVHIQLIIRRGNNNSPESAAEFKGMSYAELPSVLGVDSGTSYQFVADAGFAHGDYVKWTEAAIGKWAEDEKNYPVVFPHASIGWDNTQRNPSIAEAIVNATPDAFEACLYRTKMYIDSHPDQVPLVTINSWNEWTEGSYLLPDMRWGYRYLEAVKKVFCN